jgi:hypothetical protein
MLNNVNIGNNYMEPVPGSPTLSAATPPPNPAPPTPPAPSTSPAGAAPEDLASIPSTWPGAFGIYKYSKAAVKVNLWTLVISYVIIEGLSIILDLSLKSIGRPLGLLLGAVLTTLYTVVLLAGLRRQKVSISEAFNQGLPFYVNILLSTILVFLSLALSLLLFVIPFFFVLPRVALTSYFVIDQKLGPVDAFKASWAITKGHSRRIWGIYLATIPMALLAVTIIGIPFALYFLVMYSAALAVFYSFVKSSPLAPTTPSTAVPTA